MKLISRLGIVLSVVLLFGCASNPDKIDAAYVSPLKYEGYDCEQIAMEMDYVGQRTTELYGRLKKERKADNWQMGVGLVLFWPALFALEGGDGPEAAEYAQLKGEFEALRENSVSKRCGLEARSPDEIMKAAHEQENTQDGPGLRDPRPARSLDNDVFNVEHSSEATELAERLDCSSVVVFEGSSSGTEKWRFECSDGREIVAICQEGACFVAE